jgi:predicted nucleic acid-binding protein
VRDTHSDRAVTLSRSPERLILTPLHVAEVAHAIQQRVYRKELTGALASRALRDFEDDLKHDVWTLVDLPEAALSLTRSLAIEHGAKIGMRTLDTLHVASAIELQAREFWSFDERQRALARAVGLTARS